MNCWLLWFAVPVVVRACNIVRLALTGAPLVCKLITFKNRLCLYLHASGRSTYPCTGMTPDPPVAYLALRTKNGNKV
ncbi:hypothetical protein BDV38DRAFT_244535 [Aspergillus pseudotamarii]|uniref:Secreted protein n=1 Tax=Aspergillus pseudotamarii TaxID=132259 RepID=A0A5N6SUV4_ASPPS|nr:uncharacterized protein BDV38DRAFT_244535 [Aspergillus pseudotamarii]KAE8138402.1 hypothetical protein BDV38DRAFT_244535 [Aspergillus pseudotamarii]